VVVVVVCGSLRLHLLYVTGHVGVGEH
jgi:hypothetical protein